MIQTAGAYQFAFEMVTTVLCCEAVIVPPKSELAPLPSVVAPFLVRELCACATGAVGQGGMSLTTAISTFGKAGSDARALAESKRLTTESLANVDYSFAKSAQNVSEFFNNTETAVSDTPQGSKVFNISKWVDAVGLESVAKLLPNSTKEPVRLAALAEIVEKKIETALPGEQAKNLTGYAAVVKEVAHKVQGVLPASKKELAAENAALTNRNNQQDIIINALVKQVNNLSPVRLSLLTRRS